ncbi:MAG: hypothetical protein GY733_24495 [bacterium]|nr:hypothetical protein [bacterium]
MKGDEMGTHIATDRSHEVVRADLGSDRRVQPWCCRLLVVDDDPDLWPLITRAGRILDSDLEIQFAASSHSAINRMLEPLRFAAVLVDDCLPRPGDGLSLCGAVESLQPWADVGLMSGTSHLENSGCAFLAKPFSPIECRSFLVELLSLPHS